MHASYSHTLLPTQLRDLNKVLETFVGNEDKLNEQMRVRYKADLNGEYPDPEPEQESESDEVCICVCMYVCLYICTHRVPRR